MKLTDTKLERIWTEAADTLNGKFSMPLQLMNGGSSLGGTYLFQIDVIYHNISISIHKGIYELPLQKDEHDSCNITITAKKESREVIELALWRKDFMDKIFKSGKSATGYKKFDEIFALKASRNIERYLSKIFENEVLREELINDKYRVYNIQTVDNFITIQRKSGLKLNSSEMIISDYEKFCLFLDGLINAGLL